MRQKTNEIDDKQALALGALALDYLLSDNGDRPDQNAWAGELAAAKQRLRELSGRQPAGPFFVSAGYRKRTAEA